jgi:hypothetical protein
MTDHYREKDKLFNKHKKEGVWPIEGCHKCHKRGGCCQSHHHHIGDNCTHCGNDERHMGLEDV